MAKYQPLSVFLFPLAKREVCLTFAEIEEQLGSALPTTARKDRPWWANTLASNHASSWLIAGWKVSKVDLSGESVTFVRDDRVKELLKKHEAGQPLGEVAVTRSPRRYELLRDLLQRIPPDQIQSALTFDEIATALGGKLPRTAFHDRPWWANTKRSPQGSAWLSAGWRLDSVYLRAQIAVFRRRLEDPLRIIPRLVNDLLDGKSHSGRPSAERLAAWIGFCRRVGWYFEGTVLFERIGLDEDALSEADRVRVEEDYSVCKRELGRSRGRTNGEATVSGRNQESLNGQE